MKNYALFAGLLFACPLLAQNPPTPAPAPNPPALEQPKMAEPEEEKKADTPPPVKAPVKAPVAKKPVSTEGKVVEEIVARVNNDIITRSELDRAKASAAEDAQQECNGRCTPEQLQIALEDRQKFALRDLIDQSLLSQRGKDLGISVETDVVKQLDQIRITNKFDTQEAFEKAVTSQGLNWEDFKNNIRNRALTQAVIGKEVGQHLVISHEDAMKYYNEHKKDFERPEQVGLRAIELKTEGKAEAEIPELKKKADSLLQRVKDGEDFGALAKRFSDGSTAAQSGYLGLYKRGELSKELQDKVFSMKKNEMTDVIDTKQGFLILQVIEHYSEGEQPFEKVEPEIMDRLYSEKMEPALREYLKTLREQSYVVIKPGFQDAAGGGNSEIQEVNATPEASKEKKGHKKYLLFGKSTEPKS